jgi:hypothetical protein
MTNPNVSFACGSMGRYFLFLEKRGLESHVFPKRMSGLPEATFLQEFHGMELNIILDRTYAVGDQTGRLPRCKPDAPAAAWYVFDLFREILALCAKISRKRMSGTTLPEAKYARTGAPRKSCWK